MYADQVEAQSNRSVKDRLHGNLASDSGRRTPASGKRNREADDRWEHDLFEDSASRVSNRTIDARDLRSKLQRKTTGQATQSVRGSVSGGVRDLRENLSGILSSSQVESNPPPHRPKPAPKVSRPTRKSVIAQDPKPKKKAESVENFLQSMGLDKYSITFQAEEVDMTALIHMSDEDLKALGIPMGPRKKILLALESKPDV